MKIRRSLGIKQKIVYTAIVLAILRILYSVPVPFVNSKYFEDALASNDSLGLLNMLTGSGLSSLSVMTIGITPYITASIVVQLLSVVSPRLARLQHSAYTSDQKTYRRITYKAGTAIALLESVFMVCSFGFSGMILDNTALARITVAILWTLGSFVTLGAACYINERILRNGREFGTSLIIVMGILAAYPYSTAGIFSYAKQFPLYVTVSILILISALVVILHGFSIYMLKAGKSLPVSYSRKMSNTMVKVPGQDLTLKMLPGTVIPLIFTSTVFSFLSVIFYRLPAFSGVFNMSNWFDVYHPGYSVGIILYVLLVTGFTYYYNSISSSAEKISEDLKVMGATVNGYRPGTETVMLIRRKTKYMLLIGALMLSFLSLIPIFIGAVLHVSGIKFIGSSLLIVCSVMSEIRAEIASYRIGKIYSILKMHLKESKVS